MSRSAKYIFATILIIALCGCSGGPDIRGGSTTYKETHSSVDEAGVESTKTTEVTVVQPNNAVTNGTLDISPKKEGGLEIKTSTGQSEPPSTIASAMASANRLSPVFWVGAGIMALGTLIFFLGDRKGGLGILGCGAAMVAGAYLLAEYSLFFLLFLIGIIVWAIYNYHQKKLLKTTAIEAMNSVELIKPELSPESHQKLFVGTESAGPAIQTVQSPKTISFYKENKAKGLI